MLGAGLPEALAVGDADALCAACIAGLREGDGDGADVLGKGISWDEPVAWEGAVEGEACGTICAGGLVNGA